MHKSKNWRLGLILFFVLACALAVTCRLFFLQILNHKFYHAEALGQQAGFKEIQGSRGQIFFANSRETKGSSGTGETKSLAINKDTYIISVLPKEIDDKNAFAKKLGPGLGESSEWVLSKLDGQEDYTVIKKGVEEQALENLKSLGFKGLYWETVPRRYYPQEGLASHIVGFVGGDQSGQYGLEGYYDDELKGKKGIKEEKRGLDLIFASEQNDSLDGEDLYLTIDYNIQFEAESLLKEVKKDLDIASGQIIVVKPDSGRILAMANYPNFDPNQYSKVQNMETFQNSAVQKLFEPGSVMKPFSMGIALNEGKVAPETVFTDNGFVKFGKYTIYNFAREKYGEQAMSGILEKSINTGAVFLEEQVPHSTFFNYMEKLGFTKKTGIGLQGEVYSRNELLKNGSDVEYATASFGQGIEITPLQLIKAFSIFANKGRLQNQCIIEKTVKNGKEFQQKCEPAEQIFSEKTASEVTAMMTNVVERGFGSGAKIQGYYLAGKTGTAEVPLKNGKGYEANKTIQSFVGFGPSMNPQFVILVKLDDPKVPKSSLSAVPLFKKLAQYIINYWQIPPDYDTTKK